MLYKKLLVEAIRKAGSYGQLPAGVLKFDWVVNIKPVGNGQAVLKYLAPCIYRVAICDNRILSVDEQGVTYRVKPSGERIYKTRHLDGESFVRAFAQHILPPGFHKLRYYGFMSSNCKLQLVNAYEQQTEGLRSDPGFAETMDPLLRGELKDVVVRMQETMRENELAIGAARAANEKLAKAILEAVSTTQPDGAGYSKSGSRESASAAPPISVQIDQHL